MNETRTISLTKQFDQTDSCHYILSVYDEVKPELLPKNNLKYMQVFVEKFDGLDIFIANGTDERSINLTSKVNVTNRNFTIPPTGKFFVQVQPAVGSLYGDYD